MVTEVLTQQIGGAPQQLFNGGLPMTRLSQLHAGERPGCLVLFRPEASPSPSSSASVAQG
ncbi:hypothetical protein [Actinoplanes sp. NPDC051411]|uniref:hypothetical protein n=1 Tax=Actinoplanes sp. NPDC051411 TaxID=3155522 RepID=UPI00344224A5